MSIARDYEFGSGEITFCIDPVNDKYIKLESVNQRANTTRSIKYDDVDTILKSGNYTPTWANGTGATWNTTGSTTTGHYLRVNEYVHCTIVVSTLGTTGTGALMLMEVSLPVTAVGTTEVSGTCHSNIASSGGSNYAICTGYVGLKDTSTANLYLCDITGAARAGTSAFAHHISASFLYKV